MSSTFTTASPPILSFNSTPSFSHKPNLPLFPLHHRTTTRLTVKAHSSNSPIPHHLKTLAGAAIFTAVALNFPTSLARAESPPPATLTDVLEETETETTSSSSPLSNLLETNEEALKSLLQQKLEHGEDEEALKILSKLISAQPEATDWKFLAARLTSEIGDTKTARGFYEEILKTNPLSFEALFENALLMDRCGEGEAVIKRLEEALNLAEEDNKAKEARDVKLIMAQIQFLQKNVEEALGIYQQLTKEDPNDFRPYFCRGMIYSLLDKNDEAKEQFAKYRELSPKKFEVDGYLRTPLSRIKVFGADES